MNVPTKLTVSRIFMAVVIIFIMVMPFETLGIDTHVVRNNGVDIYNC